jgi:hypothetical protein
MKNYDNLGIQIPRVLLPNKTFDLTRWAVIACDQFTSQPEYWEEVKAIVGDSPSTYHLVLPEVYLGTPQEDTRVKSIRVEMHRYLDSGMLVAHDGMILVERAVGSGTRHGLLLCLDLEKYDFLPGSQSLIRATEGTIMDRLPPRMRIREGALLEIPHILVLIDDIGRTVIEPVVAQKNHLPPLYDFDLMLGSGHLSGYSLAAPEIESSIVQNLARLAEPAAFHTRYHLSPDLAVLLFAMGDGNHSLATAKKIWDRLKTQVGADHPARYALVEVVNVHDEGLTFEPIHRILFEVKDDLLAFLQQEYPGQVSYTPLSGPDTMATGVNSDDSKHHIFGLVTPHGYGLVKVDNPSANLPVATLQNFLDKFLKAGGASKIDYVHGGEVVSSLGTQPGNAGFYLPAIAKTELFRTVILENVLPRKAFSMGEAREKRFYMESRRIQ